jgi:hypothetical protein
MGWNHRVIRHEDESGVSYAIHECYYTNKGDTIPTSWTEDAIEVMADTRPGLFWVLAKMTEAVAQPVLQIRDGKLVEIEPVQELSDDLKKAVEASKEYAEGMA